MSRLCVAVAVFALGLSTVARADDDDDDPKSAHVSKPVAKPEPKAAVKPELKPEVKPEAKAVARPEPKPEPKAVAKPEPKVEAKPVKPTATVELSDPFSGSDTKRPPKPSKIDSKANLVVDPFVVKPSKPETRVEPRLTPLPNELPPPPGGRIVRVRLLDGSTVLGNVRAELSEALVIECNLGLLSIPRARISMVSYDPGSGGTKRAPVQQLDDDLPPKKR